MHKLTSIFFFVAALMTGIEPHSNVVRIYGLCQELSNFSLVMEFMPHGSLDSFLHKEIKVSGWDERLLYRVVIGIARGMAHLSANGVVHRDLAARNVLLGDRYEPKISDFGMSRMIGENQTGVTNCTKSPAQVISSTIQFSHRILHV